MTDQQRVFSGETMELIQDVLRVHNRVRLELPPKRQQIEEKWFLDIVEAAEQIKQGNAAPERVDQLKHKCTGYCRHFKKFGRQR